MKNNTEMLVTNLTCELAEAIQLYAFNKDYRWSMGDKTVKYLEEDNYVFRKVGKYITCNDNPNGRIVYDAQSELAKILKWFNIKNEVIVELNSEYKAIVTKENFKVGCQTFSWDVIDELVKAKNELG